MLLHLLSSEYKFYLSFPPGFCHESAAIWSWGCFWYSSPTNCWSSFLGEANCWRMGTGFTKHDIWGYKADLHSFLILVLQQHCCKLFAVPHCVCTCVCAWASYHNLQCLTSYMDTVKWNINIWFAFCSSFYIYRYRHTHALNKAYI